MTKIYTVLMEKNAAKSIKKIHNKDKNKILLAIEKLAIKPKESGKELKGKHKSKYSMRVGNYRILYQVKEDKLIVLVVGLGHRREVYR